MKIQPMKLRKFLSLVMVFAMVLTMIPVTAAAADLPAKLYLKPNSNWASDGARFSAYFYGNGEKWVSMTDADGDGTYEVTVPSGYTNVIFCRMNPASSANDWGHKWNQSSDLTIPENGNNLFTVESGVWDGGGSWGTYSGPLFTVAGTISPAGWSPENGEKLTDEDADNIYTYTYTDVKAGNYAFKVTDGSWSNSWPGSDYAIAVADDGSTVTVSFNAATKAVSAVVDKEYTVTFNGTNVTSDGAATVKKNAAYSAKLTAADGYDLPETVTVTMGGTAAAHTYADGTVSIAAVTGDVVITAEGVKKPVGMRTVYLDAGGSSLWDQGGAWFDAWVWGSSKGDAWYTFTDEDADGVYRTEIPEDATGMKILRKDPANTAHDWNKWDETGDLNVGTDNYFTITRWSGGEWSTQTPPTPVYTVTGTGTLCGNDWDPTVAANNMTSAGSGKYQKVFENVPAGTHEFKITVNNAWFVSWGNNGNNASVTVEEDGSTVTVTFEPETRAITTDVEAPVGTVTVYFRNDWLWTEVSAYWWGGTVPCAGWPGVAMTFVETVNGQDIYKAEIPTDVEGFLFNGKKDDGSGNLDQSPDLTGPADGDAYYMHWDNGNRCSKFDYTPGGSGSGSSDVEYEATFHFANTLGWGAVNLYTWTQGGSAVSGSWPGNGVSMDGDGFYTATVKYTAPAGQGLNFIFNNGSTQTVDLSVPASDFVDNKVEKWVVLTTQTDSKYNADILTSGDSLAISPIVKDTSVTFQYKNASASAVEVRGTMCGWEDGKGVAMTKNSHGVWSVTLNDVASGIHEYKFVVDGSWIADPLNSWTENGNSAFLISDPSKDVNKVTVVVHYNRADGNYENWNLYMWNENGSQQYDFTAGEGEVTTTIQVEGRATQSVNFKVRKSVGSNKWAAEEGQVTVDLSTIVSGTIHVYTGGKYANNQTMENDVVFANKISDVQYDYEENTVTVYTNKSVQKPETAFGLVKDNAASAWTYDSASSTGGKYVFKLTDEPQLSQLYRYKVRFYEQAEAFHDVNYDIGIDSVYASDKFADEFTYNGSDLGATYTPSATTFRLWAPTAESVSVKLYSTGSDSETGAAALDTYAMTQDVNGTWIVTINGELKNVYYTYIAKVNGETVEVADPYSQATGVNGLRSMVIDLDSTDPEGWDSDKNPNPVTSQTDAVIYELHVRDFSIDASSGVTEANRGKFLAFTEEGTTVNGEGQISTGVDYLADLGITHLHLLPVYDYASVDETTCDSFNWGYDPQNYNVPEGSYSTNPYDGNVRVGEMKQMVKSLHDNGISVVMDVVYNHVYDAETFSYNVVVPGYFSRVDSNVSGCGNDTASEREMVRKYIVESVLYWTEEYHIDGFRFDLVGLIDVETINQIVEEVHAVRPDVIFYGEGWDMDGTNKEPGTEMAKQGNASKTPGFAYFSDSIRNLLGGDNGKSTGFASGSANRESEVVSNAMANPWWTNNPQQVVQYASCHDNYTLADKIIISTGRSSIDSTVMKMSDLAASVYLTSQGVPFIHAGEEIFREKLDENGKRNENSYNASDYVNHIDWTDLEKAAYAANVEYYKGLIELRKAHPALRLSTAEQVKANVYNQQASGNVVSFWVDGRNVTGETHDSIYIIYNANSSARTVELPEGSWDVLVSGNKAGTAVLNSVSGTVSVEGISTMVLVQEESTEEPTGPAPKSDVALPGSFNSWNTSSFMEFAENSTTVTTITISLPAGSYEFKVKQGDTWYGNNGTIEDTTTTSSATGWEMDGGAGNCWLKATGGAYTFTFDTATKKLIVEHDPEGGDFGDPGDYYLAGWINGVDYAVGTETGEYKFEDGKITTTFTSDSYVFVKNGDSSEKYMTDGYKGAVTSVIMYDTAKHQSSQWDKLLIPGGTEVTITMEKHDDGTITLSYVTTAAAVEDATGIQQGVTLHCWNWSFAEIEKHIPDIAAQGYTAIQTSPVQAMKEPTNLEGHSVGGNWWVYYQPVDFVITTDEGNALGTKEELASMVATAHRYGVKVVVDVVANHLGNQTGNDLSEAIPDYLRSEDYWHDISTNTTDYTNRFDMTQHCMGGLPDLNTANSDVQGYVLQFLKDCVDLGVDGFRFDAAKHIETPNDDSTFASDFWPVVVGGAEDYAQEEYGKDLYIYGELLDDPAIAVSAYTQYMAVTDNGWGNHLRTMVVSGTATMVDGYYKSAPASALVIWAESHDTFATDDQNQSSFGVSEQDIVRTWALVAARADAMGLYLARPASMDQALGTASVTAWACKEVGIINAFHNAFAGEDEVVSNENGISYVERGDSGVVLVKMTGTRSAEVSVTAHAMADGTYVDQLTGNTFTVANGKITGQIGVSGIAVVYNAEQEQTHTVTVEKTEGGEVSVDPEAAAVGQLVTVTAKPDEGKTVEKVTVLDDSGKEISVTDHGDGTWSFRQPDGDVTVKVTFKAKSSTPPTGDAAQPVLLIAMMGISALAALFLLELRRRKTA